MKIAIATALSAAAATSLVTPAFATTTVNWARAANWTGGGANPAPAGAASWSYESMTPAAGSSWFTGARTPMIWDSLWGTSGLPAFAHADDANPRVDQAKLVHGFGTDFGRVPAVRWTPPVGTETYSISGNLQLAWSFPIVENTLDFVIARVNGQGAVAAVLRQGTGITLPAVGSSVNFPISLSGETIAPGESVMISFRARTNAGAASSVNMFDTLTFSATIVPAPGSATALALGGFALLRRRRR